MLGQKLPKLKDKLEGQGAVAPTEGKSLLPGKKKKVGTVRRTAAKVKSKVTTK